MANEPDEVRSHSQDQSKPAKPAEGAGPSASTPDPLTPPAPDAQKPAADAGASAETSGKQAISEGESAQESSAEAGEGGPVAAPTEGAGSSEPGTDPASHTEDGEWHDPAYDNGTSDYYTEEQMYGGEGTGHHHDGTVPEEDPNHTSEQDYYHYPGDEAAGAEPDAAAADKEASGAKPESPDSFLEADDDGEMFGGPVKSFLEHLEDFRWVLIKSIAAVLVAMVVCLVALPSVISFLTWPLRNPWLPTDDQTQVMRLHFGTNTWQLPLATNQVGSLNVGTNRFVDYDVVPTVEGTNLVLSLEPTPEKARSPFIPKVPSLVILDPVEAFMLAIQVAIYGGVGMASPFVLFFIGQFLVPALKKKEKHYLYYGAGIGTGLFAAGAAFCYFVLMPVAVLATVQFGNWMGFSSDMWRGAGYLSFVTKFMVGMGLMFELPVPILILVKIGILDHHKLSKFRPYWVILNLTLSGFITPSGDPFSMVLMAAPIHVLYEISYVIARYWAWRDRKREAAEARARGE